MILENQPPKPAEPDDPMELNAMAVPGEVRNLARCLVEEFAQIGYGADELLHLFERPEYRLMNRALRVEGKASVRRIIEEVLAESGTYRVRMRTGGTGP